jgi:hypothetical protein
VASLAVLGLGVATGRVELVVLAPLLPGVWIQDLERYDAVRLAVGWSSGLGSPTAWRRPAVDRRPPQAESRDPL